MNKFKVGDRVEFIKQCYVAKPGEKGTVRVIENNLFGVEMDNGHNGHDLDGRCKDGHGCWTAAANIRLLENRFKVGQRVRIRSWESMKEEFGLDEDGDIPTFNNFVRWMKHLCGRTATIKSIEGKNVSLEGWSDDSGDMRWVFSTDMLEPAEKLEVGQIYRVGKLSHQHEWEGAIIHLAKSQTSGFKIKSIRGEAPAYFMNGSEYARSLTILTGPQIGEAIKQYDADHAEKKTGVREVKRRAKVGEKIKIVRPQCAEGYGVGDIGTVTKVYDMGVFADLKCGNRGVFHDEYVVLEGYKPEQKGRRFYNQKEIAEAKAFVLDTIRDLAEKDVHVILAHSSGDEDDNGAFTCYILNHDAFIDADEDGFKAEAKRYGSVCSDNDEPNEWIGKCVALCKALHKPVPAFIMGD